MRLNITKTTYRVGDFLSWQKSGALRLSPNFQRRPVWPAKAKSLLIDTVVGGLPMPIILIREKSDLTSLATTREVVDGQQRLRTLISFIDPRTLPDLKSSDPFTVIRTHNKEIAGKTFQQLSKEVRQSILDYEISVHVLPSDTEDRTVLQIFARMNSTGIKLNAQEIRNAEFYGPFKKAAYELAYEQLARWRSWRVFGETDIARMQEVEETSDLLLMMISGMHAKRQPLINKAYKDFDDEFPAEQELRRRFQNVMDTIDDELGDYIPTSPFKGRALFGTLFTLYYDEAYGLGSVLTKSKPQTDLSLLKVAVKKAGARLIAGKVPEDVLEVLRGASGDLRSRKKRLEFLAGVLRSVQD